MLHVGRRTYPDGEKHLEIMRRGAESEEEIVRLKALPEGFSRGELVAIVEIGETTLSTEAERYVGPHPTRLCVSPSPLTLQPLTYRRQRQKR